MDGWALRGLSCCKHCKEPPRSANTRAQRHTQGHLSPALGTWSTVPYFQNSFLISTVTCSCREKQDTFNYLKSRHKKKIRLLGLQAPEEKTESALFAPDNSAKIPWGLTVRLMRNSPATPI